MKLALQSLALLSLVFVAPSSWEIEAETETILQRDSYAYCQDGNTVTLSSAEAIWCPFADPVDSRCPGLAQACERDKRRGCDGSSAGPCPSSGTPRGCGPSGSEPCYGGSRGGSDGPRTGSDGDGRFADGEFGEPETGSSGGTGGQGSGQIAGRGTDGPGDELHGSGQPGAAEDLDLGSPGGLGTRERRPIDRNHADKARREQLARERAAQDHERRLEPASGGSGDGGGSGAGGADKHGGGSGEKPSSGDGGKASPNPRKEERPSEAAERRPERETKDPQPRDEPEQVEVEVPAGMSGLAKLMLLLLIGLAVFLIARAIFRNMGSDDEPEADAPDDAPVDPKRNNETNEQRQRKQVVETDVERLLRRAREAAARGDYGAAIDDTYAALLRNLEGHGRIEVTPWRTNGDYVRDLRSDPSLRTQVREVVREVEPVQFGDTVPDSSRFESVMARVKKIVQPGASLLAVFLLGGMAGLGCGMDTIAATRGSLAKQQGPLGSAAVIELLDRTGVDAEHRTHDLDRPGAPNKALVLLEGIILDSIEWDALLTWVHEGGTLVVASGVDLPAELGVQTQISTSGDVHLSGETFWIHDGRFQVPTGTKLELTPSTERSRTRTLLRRGPEPVRDDYGYGYGYGYEDPKPRPSSDAGELYAVEISRGAGAVIVFADGQLFTNASMGVADNAEYVVHFLGQFEQVEFIDELTGTGATNPLEGLLDSRFAPIFLQLLAFMALLFLWRGLPFAKLRDPIVASRRAFVDHIRALAQRYSRARASRHVARHYATWFLDHLADELGRRNAGSLHQLAQALAVRTGRDEASVMKLLLAANDLKNGSGASDPSKDFQTIHQLSALLEQAGFKRSIR